ncbi:MAG TPA: IPT/TIG domain-containing protein [Bryobacteraceae bacterium]|jgi:uncharacterized protein (TIGR03437 family)|nr:IPT/TIG domain-containing protein [Bryobacteraceae bacterium]
MDAIPKGELENRLGAYAATLRASGLKRPPGKWQVYAAVSGSAMAMMTGAATSLIGSETSDTTSMPIARATANEQSFPSFRSMPMIRAVRSAMTRLDAQAAQPPVISPLGVVPIFGSGNTIQPGEWVSIYGSNLAGADASWNGDFPTLLGGTQVTINGKAAYLEFVSPNQINLQAPDDTATGTVPVVVTTAAGSVTSTVTLGPFAPAFDIVGQNIVGKNYVSGVILRSNDTGAYGGGTYDLLGPTGNSFGYYTVAAQPGDIVELFGVGFGPTASLVPAGQAFSGSVPIDSDTTFSLYINGVFVRPSFIGLSNTGLYQINLTVPNGLGEGDAVILLIIGGMQTQRSVLFPLQQTTTIPPVVGGTVGSGGGPVFFSSSGPGSCCGGGFSGGFSGGSGGGGGGSGSARKPGGKKKRWEPRLKFTK